MRDLPRQAVLRTALATFCALGLVALSPAARAEDDSAAQAARWTALQQAIFAEHPALRDGGNLIQLNAPARALDAALVPVTITVSPEIKVKSVYMVIDSNPSPLAAHITFGPKADGRSLTLRVRINDYTLVHAVAETTDGNLYETAKFVKAAGGCSAPSGPDDEVALKGIGRMKLRILGDYTPGKPEQAQLLIRHPNFNGMQMNQLTRTYTPARFIRSTDITYNGAEVLHMDSDISLSTDPAITFGFVPWDKGEIKVVVHDSKNATFEHSFPVPAHES